MLGRRLVPVASKGSKTNRKCDYLLSAASTLEQEIDAIDEDDEGPTQNKDSDINILARKLITIVSKGSKTKRKQEYLVVAAAKLETDLKAIDEEEHQIQKHVRSNATRNITNAEIEGESCCNITLQNPERVKSKGRPVTKK
jgi:hypothetical protein